MRPTYHELGACLLVLVLSAGFNFAHAAALDRDASLKLALFGTAAERSRIAGVVACDRELELEQIPISCFRELRRSGAQAKRWLETQCREAVERLVDIDQLSVAEERLPRWSQCLVPVRIRLQKLRHSARDRDPVGVWRSMSSVQDLLTSDPRPNGGRGMDHASR